jgi:hypothetical protein
MFQTLGFGHFGSVGNSDTQLDIQLRLQSNVEFFCKATNPAAKIDFILCFDTGDCGFEADRHASRQFVHQQHYRAPGTFTKWQILGMKMSSGRHEAPENQKVEMHGCHLRRSCSSFFFLGAYQFCRNEGMIGILRVFSRRAVFLFFRAWASRERSFRCVQAYTVQRTTWACFSHPLLF